MTTMSCCHERSARTVSIMMATCLLILLMIPAVFLCRIMMKAHSIQAGPSVQTPLIMIMMGSSTCKTLAVLLRWMMMNQMARRSARMALIMMVMAGLIIQQIGDARAGLTMMKQTMAQHNALTALIMMAMGSLTGMIQAALPLEMMMRMNLPCGRHSLTRAFLKIVPAGPLCMGD